MFCVPAPRGVVAGSNPLPSSPTVKAKASPSCRRVIVTRGAFAYFATFWSASRQQK